ncbi:Allantoicase [Elasticomyces elasticus]|nr:Allantoicase [Elasticomyces elasticus]
MEAPNEPEEGRNEFHAQSPAKPRQLPEDLPRSLDDRRPYTEETELYDAWQGQSQFLTAPSLARPTSFNLSLAYQDEQDEHTALEDSDRRLVQMMAAQARLKDDDTGANDEEDVLTDRKLSPDQKSEMLQSFLFMAASNGDAKRVQRLVRGQASSYVKVGAVDAEGTPPLVYASCFGHKDVVLALLDSGAEVDKQDRNQWSPLMWAMTNRHKDIAKILLDHGASPDIKSSTGRTAFDFVAPNSEMSEYLHDNGYAIGHDGIANDFYDSGFSQDRFEEEMAESEMKRRMMMESAVNLEVDLGNLGLDEQPESPDEFEDGQEFVWDRCLNDQMFVFQEYDIDRILDVVVTNMTPQRSPTQKPVPANVVFLAARYAHYHANKELLQDWLVTAQKRIYAVIDKHQWDMTILAFWMSNATLLLHYLKKDVGLSQVTTQFQAQMAELIHEIYILVIRDAERRMDKVLNVAMLDHETIPGFEDVHFQNEWNFLRSKSKVKAEPIQKQYAPPSPKRKAQISPRNITSLLSSTLFVLDLYDIHSVITTQILSQLIYWLSAETFNRIMSNKRYLARTKAMQIRMNISTLEDWARSNNRQPEHYEKGSMTFTGETTVDAARRHLAPVVQLLQWLQCFSSLGDDHEALESTLQQLPQLSTAQLVHVVKHYRAEVGEKTLAKSALKYIQDRQRKSRTLTRNGSIQVPDTPKNPVPATPVTPAQGERLDTPISLNSPTPQVPAITKDEEDDSPESTLIDPALLLPFSLPTSTDMLISYGAGFGGLDRERERKYIPTVPPEFLAKLDPGGRENSIYETARWSDEASTT